MLCLIPVSLLLRQSKLFKPQVSVTCRHKCFQDCQPQNVLNENTLFEVIKCLSQAITRCEHVVAASLPKESKIVQSLNVPVFSPNQVMDYESLNDNVSQEVGETRRKKNWLLSLKMKTN